MYLYGFILYSSEVSALRRMYFMKDDNIFKGPKRLSNFDFTDI